MAKSNFIKLGKGRWVSVWISSVGKDPLQEIARETGSVIGSKVRCFYCDNRSGSGFDFFWRKDLNPHAVAGALNKLANILKAKISFDDCIGVMGHRIVGIS